MQDSQLDALADRILTPEFVTRLHDAKCAMQRSIECNGGYCETDLAQDLDVPLPVARVLLSFIGAIMAEGQMTKILEGVSSHLSETMQ